MLYILEYLNSFEGDALRGSIAFGIGSSFAINDEIGVMIGEGIGSDACDVRANVDGCQACAAVEGR